MRETSLQSKHIPLYIKCIFFFLLSRFSPYNVEGLQNGHEYRFRVFADNLHGRSDPSQPSEPVTIKPEEKTRKNQRRHLGDGLPRGEYDGPPITDYDRFCKCTHIGFTLFSNLSFIF